ncbi:YihY/virulence factor BrkB family protein [Roseibium litorale]|uniref:YihY/virulence factor BrkB family protein n=1 Tax=Roseibium litorale TaxID=2803841 RepID=A0ABR9CMA4_9HYPH|nr:YihY/virulence factor BrkB family protein [Roseibium litorale]MBD8891996.1 YihY/virulence factor BrkB family protein [Roseibium litorale]
MTGITFIFSAFAIIRDIYGHFSRDDGFAMASHVALSVLLAVFPLLIFIAALAGFFGLEGAANSVSDLIFDAWPQSVADPVVREIHQVLTVPRGDILTFGVVASLWFASNGLEALRTALNRAYRTRETRSFIILRLQSLGLVVAAAVIMIAFTFLVVLGPLVIEAVVTWVPGLEEQIRSLDLVRLVFAGLLVGIGLLAAHWLLPAGERKVVDLLPGVLATMVLWMICGAAFGAYLARFANYVSTYGGLAGIMSALVFLYICSLAFILGGELNAALIRQKGLIRSARARSQPPAGAGG